LDGSEQDLIRRAKAGDSKALHELTDLHAPHLFRVAYRLTGRVADSEDLVQETLMAAIGSLRRFDGRSKFSTWLIGILVRQAALARRKKRRPEIAAGQEVTAGAAEKSDRKMDVAAALAELSDEHREVVVLREYEAMTYDEIAEALGVPRGTVESRLHRARQELRTVLQDYQEGG
jgi:RNA polymerase sigma-70 factor (ECF subfamily)